MRSFAIHGSLVILSFLVLTSCGDPAKQENRVVEKEPIVLNEEDLFKGNIVLAYLENDVKFLQEANELFLKGINSFRNENNLDSADYYLKHSILKEPTANAYFELGNVYMDKQRYDQAMLAYGLAEQLDYEPLSKILYNKACIYSLLESDEMAGKYLEYALQAGYTNMEHIDKDEDLENLRDSYYYKEAVDRGLRGMSNADNLFWLQFKKQFAVMDFPIKLKMTIDEKEYEGLKYISYDYEKYISEMRDEAFSREVSKSFFYYARPYETENYIALVYIVKDEFMGEYAPLTYRMATYTHNGKLIDKKEIAGRKDLDDPIMVSTINKDKTISVKLVEAQYEKDPYENGYWDNPMIGQKTIGSMKFRVTKEGRIVADDVKDIAQN